MLEEKTCRTKSESITSISFSLTNDCNIKCSFCPRTIIGVTKKKINHKVRDAILSIANTVPKVQILGLGEPLTCKDFIDIIKRLKDNGAALSFTTNGLLLNHEIIESLCRNNVDEVIISIQGATKKIHEDGKNSQLFKLLQNIEQLVNFKQIINAKLPKISFNFVGNKNNINELPKIVELANKVGVNQVYCANIVPFNQNTCDIHLHKIPDKASRYINIAANKARDSGISLTVYASLSPKPIECRWTTRPHIGLEGDVYPCNFIGAQDSLNSVETIWYNGIELKIDIKSFRLGNILRQNIEEIWNGPEAAKLRKAQQEYVREDHSIKWDEKSYSRLIQEFTGKELSPYDVCKICPHRFKITH